jgi:putative transposase
VILTYKYRLYPTAEQEAVMSEILWVGCWLYNRALDYRRKRWRESRHTATYYEQAAMWRDWRNEQPDENPLRVLNMSAGQQVLRRLDSAYREFFKGQRGKPRFKRCDRFNSVNFKPGDGANLKGRKLYLQNVGFITVRWHRELPGDAKPKNIILLRKASGWYVLLQVELPDLEPEPHEGPAVGIDVGIHHALALSDGTIIDSPRHLEQSLRKLRVLQRTVARRRKGSRRWWKAVCQVQRQQERIANQRRDWWHKRTAWLVASYGVIALEDLGLNFMLRNSSLARAAHDVSIGIFRDLLDYKAVRAGVEVITVDPKHTSQVCHECGCIVEKKLSERVHCCPLCGYTVDRDVNAALNILSRSGRDRQALTWPVGASVA